MDNYIGRLLDNRYEILEAIGSGGMAVVYKARCHRLNRLVALKILKDELSQDAEFRRRFHAESQAVAMLSHPNIVSVYDVSHSDNVDYIVMELIDGITLKQYMQQKGVLNWREVLHFSTQIAKALEHAHSRGIIHRDIKPHNIMILKDGTVKVADFGIARVSSAQSTLTREALGSVHYISPEQAKGSKIDYRSDLYSLGVVMYEMLTGRPPYDGETPVSVAIKHINAGAPMPRSLNPQIPIGLEQITMHAMQADPDDRYESATELLCDLDEFRRNPNVQFHAPDEMPPAAEPPVRPQPQRPAQERGSRTAQKTRQSAKTKSGHSNTVALAAGIICIMLALGFIGYFLYSIFFADFFADTEDISVPQFVGKYEEELELDNYPNLSIQIVGREPSDTAPSGMIVDQTPQSGRLVKAGAVISLTVSSGPSTDTMRDLVNYTESNARTLLETLSHSQNLNLNIEAVYESSELIIKDAVIRTDPVKGESLVAGQTVTLYVSTGPDIKMVPVPELVGLNEDEAIRKLEELKLKYGVHYVDDNAAKGTVVFQSIQQLEEVKEGTTVNIQVSNGPKENDKDDEEEPGSTFFGDPSVIYIPMPESSGNETIVVSILLDGEVYEEMSVELVTVSERGLPIAPNVEGIHTITVMINGKEYLEMNYNFDTGEQVP